MIKLHYAHVDNEADIPCYDIENKEALIRRLRGLFNYDDNRVTLLSIDGEVYVSSNSNHIINIIDELFLAHSDDMDGLLNDDIHIQEYKSFEAAYEVALMMKEEDVLCYEPD